MIDLDLAELGALHAIAELARGGKEAVAHTIDLVAGLQMRVAAGQGLDVPEVWTLRALAALLVMAVERAHPGTFPPELIAMYCDYAPGGPTLHVPDSLN